MELPIFLCGLSQIKEMNKVEAGCVCTACHFVTCLLDVSGLSSRNLRDNSMYYTDKIDASNITMSFVLVVCLEMGLKNRVMYSRL